MLKKLQYNITDIFILKNCKLTNFQSNGHPLAAIGPLNQGFTVVGKQPPISR
jgi:hypothetical protein